MRRLLVVAAFAAIGFVLLPTAPAAAHPLGNFSVNRYAGLTVSPDRIDALAVADVAELPTLQDPPASCTEAADALIVTVNGIALRWTVAGSSLTFASGAGGLRTSRLECRLSAPATIGRSAAISVTNRFRDDRIGWRELVAAGSGVRLSGSSLPTTSVSGELRNYPKDLLASPSDVRSARFTAAPGDGSAPVSGSVVAASGVRPLGLTGPLAGAERWLDNVVGGQRLTPLVGLLAVLLALVLGAAHAALPGHGKTVMAAYLAGSRGRTRDAVAVGATVTLTHTGGVLALGLVLTTVAGVAGEAVLGWLGLVSGALVAAVGVGALGSAIRRRRLVRHRHEPGHGHTHEPGHRHTHEPGHRHSHGLGHGHTHGPGQGHDHGPGKWGIAGIGIAGGLVPSPSALIVLLGAVALGRTVFGVLLVLAYGLGMAATLTAAGLLLVRLRNRLEGRLRFVARWRALAPQATAALIILVGLGLAGRALSALA